VTEAIRWEGAEALRQHLVPIDSLKPDPENHRFNLATPQGRGAKTKHLKRLQESLLRWGQVRAVLTDADDVLVAGHHVTEAARLIGWTHVAAIIAEFATEEDRHDYNIADNVLATRGWESATDQVTLFEGISSFEGTGLSLDEVEAMKALGTQNTEQAPIDELQAHPENYRQHPREQLEHLTASLKEHGIYRNVVVANDGTILAGHGLVEAAREMGVKVVPVTRLKCGPNDPEALRVMAGDNELAKLGAVDDRLLTDMLREVRGDGGAEALLGTGFDPQTLAALVMTTRPEAEIEHHDAASEWIGMPAYQEPENRIKLILTFQSLEERQRILDLLEIEHVSNQRWTMTAWWPDRGERQDLKSLLFADEQDPGQMDVEECIAEAEADGLAFPDLPADHPANLDARA
jgi:ParB-like chromosome segregation protein Spo0J